MKRYSVFFLPVYKHRRAMNEEKYNIGWQWLGRDFVSIRSAKRFAKINKICCYLIYVSGNNTLSDYVYHIEKIIIMSYNK